MADPPVPILTFGTGCPDCAQRTVALPRPLPTVGDDFDWRVRDFDGFRTFMLEDLMAAFPQRTRWTEGDFEVVIVEALAAVLDQLSDMLDRVTGEAYLETARRPQSVRRLLHFIGYEPELAAGLSTEDLESTWASRPELMNAARLAGPRSVQQQRRMVTAQDYGLGVQAHPVVTGATAWIEWSGAWSTIRVAIIGWEGHTLDEANVQFTPAIEDEVRTFNEESGLEPPSFTASTTLRSLLTPYLEAFRMAGQEAVLQDAGVAPITMSISVGVNDAYFQSEVRAAIAQALGRFFAFGQRTFGQNLYESDILKLLTAIEGVDDACLNRLKRLGRQFPDDTSSGEIMVGPTEIVACENDPAHPEKGYYRLTLHGGQSG
jgi:hypothetical protein